MPGAKFLHGFHSVSVYRLNGETRKSMLGDILELTDVLPGFRLAVADIFARPRSLRPSLGSEQP
jgi:hypothetical protein